MQKKYDLAAVTGQYQKDGQTRNRYMNIGAIWQGDHGYFMTLNAHFNPAGVPRKDGSESIMVAMFEPKAGSQQGQQQQSQGQQRQQSQSQNQGQNFQSFDPQTDVFGSGEIPF